MDNPAQIMFLMLASLWVAYSAITTSFKIINEVRDKIIQGKNNVGDLSIKHRKLLLNNDWMIINFGTSAILFVYAYIIFRIPCVISLPGNNTTEAISTLFVIIAFLPLIGAIGFLYGGYKDYTFMKDILNEEMK